MATVLSPPHGVPRPTPRAENWVCFSCSIPLWFALSNNLSTTNARQIWLRFGIFLSPPARLFNFTTPTPRRQQRGLEVRRKPSPAGYCLPPTATDRRIAKDRMGPIWPSGPSILLSHRTRRFLRTSRDGTLQLAADQPLAILTWHKANPRQRFEACLPDHTSTAEPALSLLSVICRYSPKQLGMVSPEFQKRLVRRRRLDAPYATGGPDGRRVY